jgi:hypothetical protein
MCSGRHWLVATSSPSLNYWDHRVGVDEQLFTVVAVERSPAIMVIA